MGRKDTVHLSQANKRLVTWTEKTVQIIAEKGDKYWSASQLLCCYCYLLLSQSVKFSYNFYLYIIVRFSLSYVTEFHALFCLYSIHFHVIFMFASQVQASDLQYFITCFLRVSSEFLMFLMILVFIFRTINFEDPPPDVDLNQGQIACEI